MFRLLRYIVYLKQRIQSLESRIVQLEYRNGIMPKVSDRPIFIRRRNKS